MPDYEHRLMREDEVSPAHGLSVACFEERANSEAFIRHRYFGPGGPEVDVVVADVGGRLIGQQAVTTLPFIIEGRAETVGMFTDGMTHPDYRGRGVFRGLLEEAQRIAFEERNVSLLLTMPNDMSLPAFAKSPIWRLLPDRRLSVLLLDGVRFLNDLGVPRLPAKLIGGIGRLASAKPWRREVAGATEIGDPGEVAEGLDRLWGRAARRYEGIACRRDHAFLDWRFAQNPTWQYRYFVSRDGAGQLDAYVVTTTEQRMKTTVSHVVDMLFGDDAGSLGRLLAFVSRVLREEGTTVFGAITSSPGLRAVLRGVGFRTVSRWLSRRGFHTACAPHPHRPDAARWCESGDAWYLTLADFDTI